MDEMQNINEIKTVSDAKKIVSAMNDIKNNGVVDTEYLQHIQNITFSDKIINLAIENSSEIRHLVSEDDIRGLFKNAKDGNLNDNKGLKMLAAMIITANSGLTPSAMELINETQNCDTAHQCGLLALEGFSNLTAAQVQQAKAKLDAKRMQKQISKAIKKAVKKLSKIDRKNNKQRYWKEFFEASGEVAEETEGAEYSGEGTVDRSDRKLEAMKEELGKDYEALDTNAQLALSTWSFYHYGGKMPPELLDTIKKQPPDYAAMQEFLQKQGVGKEGYDEYNELISGYFQEMREPSAYDNDTELIAADGEVAEDTEYSGEGTVDRSEAEKNQPAAGTEQPTQYEQVIDGRRVAARKIARLVQKQNG